MRRSCHYVRQIQITCFALDQGIFVTLQVQVRMALDGFLLPAIMQLFRLTTTVDRLRSQLADEVEILQRIPFSLCHFINIYFIQVDLSRLLPNRVHVGTLEILGVMKKT